MQDLVTLAEHPIRVCHDGGMADTPTTPNQTRSSRPAIYLFIGAALLIGAIVSYPWPRRSEPLIEAAQRQVLQDIALERLEGGQWRLSEHKGQAVLINYWASWCGPCRIETPGLVRISQEVPGLAVVGVSMDTGDRAPVRDFVKQMRVAYPIVFPAALSQMTEGMAGLPTTVLVDPQGRVAKTYIGATREADFRADVQKVLADR